LKLSIVVFDVMDDWTLISKTKTGVVFRVGVVSDDKSPREL